MQNNLKTYVLLAVVVLIWGIIGYKIISWMNQDEAPIPQATFSEFKPKQLKSRDTFSIVADYRDPFLGSFESQTTSKRITKSSLPIKTTLPEVSIVYTGIITDTETKSNIYFITINGQQYLMNLKDKIQEVQLVSGNSIAIKVKYHNQLMTIPIQK